MITSGVVSRIYDLLEQSEVSLGVALHVPTDALRNILVTINKNYNLDALMEDGRWKMEDGRWKMEDGRWKMEDGRWKMEDGRWKLYAKVGHIKNHF